MTADWPDSPPTLVPQPSSATANGSASGGTAMVAANSPSPAACSISPTWRPPADLSTAELLGEFPRLLGWSAELIARAAAVYLELKARGVEVAIPGVLFREWVPKVAANLLAAEAVATFADFPRLLRGVAGLAVGEQRSLAAGKLVPVVLSVDAPPVEMTLRDAHARGVTHTVVAGGRVLSPELQVRQIEARKLRRPGRVPTVFRPVAAPPARGPATDAEIESLAARVEREIQARGGARPTAKWIAEIMSMCGWVPRGGWAST